MNPQALLNFSQGRIVSAELPTYFFVKLNSLYPTEYQLGLALQDVGELKLLTEYPVHKVCMLLANDHPACHRERVKILNDGGDSSICRVLLIDQGAEITAYKLCLFQLPEDLEQQEPLAFPCSLREVKYEDLTVDQKSSFRKTFEGVECEVAFADGEVRVTQLPHFKETRPVIVKTRFTEHASLIYNTGASFY